MGGVGFSVAWVRFGGCDGDFGGRGGVPMGGAGVSVAKVGFSMPLVEFCGWLVVRGGLGS